GEVTGSSGTAWEVRFEEFVFGDVRALIAFSEKFESRSHLDRFLLVESFGEGRELAKPPAWARHGTSLVLRMEVSRPASRIRAQELGTDLALTEDGDTFPSGRIVGGVDALPQKIRLCMSYQKGGGLFYAPEFGSRVSEYFALYADSPWLDRLLKLEMIRLACIPYRERFLFQDREYTPFQCVELVIS